MTNDKLIQFLKRWRALEVARTNLDYARSLWSRDVRVEFADGKSGDLAFVKWCATEIGLTGGQSQELLDRARAIKVIPDEKTWTRLGGFRAVRHLCALPKPEIVPVVEAVKATGKAVRTVIAERRLGVTPIPRKPAQRVDNGARIDAEILAGYVLRACPNAPRHIVKIAQRYAAVPRALKAVA